MFSEDRFKLTLKKEIIKIKLKKNLKNNKNLFF